MSPLDDAIRLERRSRRSEYERPFASGLGIEKSIGLFGLSKSPAMREQPIDVEPAVHYEIGTPLLTHRRHRVGRHDLDLTIEQCLHTEIHTCTDADHAHPPP